MNGALDWIYVEAGEARIVVRTKQRLVFSVTGVQESLQLALFSCLCTQAIQSDLEIDGHIRAVFHLDRFLDLVHGVTVAKVHEVALERQAKRRLHASRFAYKVQVRPFGV